MNVDALVNTYYLKVKELEKKEKSNISKLRIAVFVVLVLCVIAFILGLLAFKNVIVSAISGILMLIIVLIIAGVSLSDKNIKKDIDYSKKHNKERLKELDKLLCKYSIKYDKDTFDHLIEAAQRNQKKYDYYANAKRVFGLLCSLLALLFTALTTVYDIKLPVDTLPSIIYIGLLCATFFLSVYFIGVTELDPILRKRYYFHDAFIYDVLQLLVFKEYYTKNKIILDGDEGNPITALPEQ